MGCALRSNATMSRAIGWATEFLVCSGKILRLGRLKPIFSNEYKLVSLPRCSERSSSKASKALCLWPWLKLPQDASFPAEQDHWLSSGGNQLYLPATCFCWVTQQLLGILTSPFCQTEPGIMLCSRWGYDSALLGMDHFRQLPSFPKQVLPVGGTRSYSEQWWSYDLTPLTGQSRGNPLNQVLNLLWGWSPLPPSS